MKPLLRRSDLTDPPHFYIVTRYTEKEGPVGKYIIASKKYEVTAEELAGVGLDILPLRAALGDRAAEERICPNCGKAAQSPEWNYCGWCAAEYGRAAEEPDGWHVRQVGDVRVFERDRAAKEGR